MRINQKRANPRNILGIAAKQVYIIAYGWISDQVRTVRERCEKQRSGDRDDLRCERLGGINERLDEVQQREEELRIDEFETFMVSEEGVEEMQREQTNARGDVARVLHAFFPQRHHRRRVVRAGQQPDEQRRQLQRDEAVDHGGGVLDEEESDAEKRLGGVLPEMVQEKPEIVGLHDDVQKRVCG